MSITFWTELTEIKSINTKGKYLINNVIYRFSLLEHYNFICMSNYWIRSNVSYIIYSIHSVSAIALEIGSTVLLCLQMNCYNGDQTKNVEMVQSPKGSNATCRRPSRQRRGRRKRHRRSFGSHRHGPDEWANILS